MNGKVTVLGYSGPDAELQGKVVIPSKNNPEYGSILVEAIVNTSQNGFIRPKRRSAFVNGKIEDLKALGWVAGMQVDGFIINTESTEPTNPANPEQDLKVAGETGVVCTIEGMPIYRKSEFSFTYAPDTLVAHDNTNAIKAARARLAEQGLSEG